MGFLGAASRAPRLLWLLPLAFACKEAPSAPITCPEGSVKNATGRCLAGCERSGQCLLNEVCESGACVGQEYARPTVVVLEADPPVVTMGGASEVRYLVQGADQVEITVSDATMPSGQTSAGDAESERRTISRITVPTTIIIDASRGEMHDMAEVTIQVQGGPDAVSIESFSADRNRINFGDKVTLSWAVRNGSDNGVSIRKDGTPWQADLPTSGEIFDFLEANATYRLVAQGPGGPATSPPVTIEVVVGPQGPQITDLGLVPDSHAIQEGDNAVLWWGTADASEVLVSEGPGGVQYSTQIPELVADGAWLVSPPPTAATYEVRATAPQQPPARASKTLTVNPRPRAPRISNPSVVPAIVPLDARNEPVTVSWTVTPNNADIEIRWGGQVQRHVGSGQIQAIVNGEDSVKFEIRAFAPEGLSHVVPVWLLAQSPEEEPNDFQVNANEITNQARVGTLGRLMTELDVDWYELTVPASGRLFATIQAPNCPAGLRLELHRVGLGQAIDVNETMSAGVCPQLNQTNLDSGTYRIQVSKNGSAGQTGPLNYIIAAYVFGPDCGDGVQQMGEACDEARLDFGGVCTPACQLNPSHRYEGSESGRSPSREPAGAQTLVFTAHSGGDAADSGYSIVELPFPFPFFGRTFHGVAVFTDGYISFLPKGPDGFSPLNYVGPTFPNAVIAPFIQDLRIPSGGVRVWRDSNDADASFVIAYSGLTSPGANNGRLGAQIVLGPDGTVGIAYSELAVGEGTRFFGGIEGPEGLVTISLPGCEQGCSADTLRGRYFEFSHPPASTGGN